jgi:hypothetical protein
MLLPRSFSLPEANGLVPHIASAVAHVREAMANAYAARNEMTARAVREGESAILEHEVRFPDLTAAAEDAEEEAREEMDMLASIGVTLMSVTPAMAAVPTERAGQPALLLWHEGDERFTHWRLVNDDADQVREIKDPTAFGVPALPQ